MRVTSQLFLLCCLALLGGSGNRSDAGDWPQWLGPDRDGISKERGWLKEWPRGGPRRLWEKPIGGGYSGIVVSRGRLLLFHRVGDNLILDNLDALSGERGWRFSYPTDYEDAYGYDNGPRCCPLIQGDRVLILGPKGILHAVDFASGRVLWRRDIKTEFRLPPNFFGTGAAPLVEGDLLYCNLGGTDLASGLAFAFEVRDGKLRWKTRTDGGAYASPALATVDRVPHLFIFHRGGLSCLDPLSGKERWEFPWYSQIYYSVNGATPVAAGDLLFFSATYGTGSVCLKVKEDSYEVVWKDDLARREKICDIHWTPPIYLDGHIYAFSGRHENGSSLRCVELRTGKLRWSWETAESRLGRGSMIHSDGHFIALGERGDLALLKLSPAGHRELARVPRILRYPAWTVPTLANGFLYLRDLRRLLCLDLRAARKHVGNGAGGSASPKKR